MGIVVSIAHDFHISPHTASLAMPSRQGFIAPASFPVGLDAIGYKTPSMPFPLYLK